MDEGDRLKMLNALFGNQIPLLDSCPYHEALQRELEVKLVNESMNIINKLEKKNALELNMQDLFDEFFLEFK